MRTYADAIYTCVGNDNMLCVIIDTTTVVDCSAQSKLAIYISNYVASEQNFERFYLLGLCIHFVRYSMLTPYVFLQAIKRLHLIGLEWEKSIRCRTNRSYYTFCKLLSRKFCKALNCSCIYRYTLQQHNRLP